MTDIVISSSKADGKQLAILATDAKAGKKAYAKLNKEIHACDKVADQVWYEKGMRILKMRESGLYKWGQDKSQLVFDEKGKIIEWTFERWLETEHQVSRRHGQRLICGVEFIRKLSAPDATQNAEMGRIETPVLPSNERQIRPLLTDLQHDGERLHVWQEVVQAGEKKITAELVQRKVDEFKASGLVVEDVEIKLPSVTDKDLRTEAEKIREAKREKLIASLESVSAIEAKATQGLYDVIVLDPPWAMQKIERDVRPNQSEFDYPTMSEDELAGLAIPAADNCHIWVWTTHKFLPMALRLIDTWGMKYVCTFTWHKPGGFQPIGLPQYNCEFALYARKGVPEFIDTKAFPVCFNAPRGVHSEKPQEFYDVVQRVTAGRRLDMFNRRSIAGFDVWGNQSAQINEVVEA